MFRPTAGDLLVGVAVLLARQLDVQADRRRLAEVRAAVHGLHDAGAAARDDREPGVREQPRDALGEREVGVVGRGPRAAEDRYRRPHLVEPLGRLDEL